MADNKRWIFLVAGVAVLAALFVWLRPTGTPAPETPAPREPGVQADGPRAATVQLVVKEGRLASGPATVTVQQGDDVRIVVLADRADELHLHGYDLSLQLRPGIPEELRFVAERSGRFEYELHGAHAAIGVLEVQPK